MQRLSLPALSLVEGSRPRYSFALGLTAGIVLVASAVFVWPHMTSAQTSFSVESVGSQLGLGTADLQSVVLNIIRWALGFVTLIAVAYIIYGGYLWLTAAGNEQRVEKAKQVILQAAIGLVIIILAWAIVLFAARTAANLTNGSNTNSGGSNPCPLCSPVSSFDLTAITSCAAAPNYSQSVPRSSSISLTFNTDVTSASVQAAVTATGGATDPKLIIQFCGDDSTCAVPTTPKPVDNQVFSGSSPTAVAGNPKAEWVANANTVTFYHLSFSTDPANPDNRYFEANKYYRLQIPRNTASTALKDIRDRVLLHCQRQSGVPIIGDDFIGEHCQENSDGTLIWTFKTGTDTDGPALQVSSTQPSSAYLASGSTARPDRNVPRNAALNVTFNNAVDPASVTTANFRVYKFTTPPNATNGSGGVTETNPLDPATFDLRVSPDGTGAWLQLKNTLFESFTWYKVVAENFRNLCGTAMVNPFSWVFETSDVSPGVAQVYPNDNFAFACPSTRVFIQYNTSMWRVGSGSFNCSPSAAGSYVTDGAMSPTPTGRIFDVVDQFDASNPFNTCKIYSFTPESANLAPGETYHVGVNSDLTIDVNGTKLNYGDTNVAGGNSPATPPSQGPWSFTVKAADQCYQPPVITSVQPNQGQDGQCVSVLGDYFLKPGSPTPGANDKLTLGSQNQTVPSGAWNQQSLVSSVQAGSLVVGQPHPYQVVVDYGSQIGVLRSNTVNFQLNAGTDTGGVCLYSLNPNQGQTGSTLLASGKGFAPFTAGQSKVIASGLPGGQWPISSSADWSDSQVKNITVAVGTAVGQSLVRVQRDGSNISNPVPFDVTPPITGVPAVDENAACDIVQNITPSPNPRRGDDQVCKNAVVSARFTLPMDLTTLNGSTISLRSCSNAGSCTTPVAATVSQVGNNGFTLTPSGGLQRNTLYEVTISTGVKADASAGGKALAAPYTWQFTTADTDTPCPIAGVTISPAGPLVERITPFAEPISGQIVDQACRILNPGTAIFAWTISNSPHVADLQSGNTTVNNVATDPTPGPPEVGTAQIRVSTAGKTSGPVDIIYDPTSCQTNADCTTNRYGELCGAANDPNRSLCVNNQCTPFVNGVDPNSGSIGTWTTVKGCWFGGYDQNKSKVTFMGTSDPVDDRDGLVPSQTICGSASATWENERIVREVPKIDSPTNDPTNDAVTGPVRVTRDDSLTSTSAGDFTINTAVRPGVCRVVPDNGWLNANLTINGIRFGPDEPTKRTAQDQANLTTLGTSSAPVVMTTYTAWTDSGTQSTIDTAVPATAAIGDSEVRVKNDGQDSNPWPFVVNDPSTTGSGTCSAAQQCFSDNAANCTALGLGCGLSDHCCHAVPTIIAFQPPQDSQNICRNTAAQVTFNQPLDPLTVTPTTVRYLDGSRVASAAPTIETIGGQSTVTVNPGLLLPNALQQLSLNAFVSTDVIINNPSFESATNGVPTQWNAVKTTQSTDLPSGHTGFSALADCSACQTGEQASIAQNIPGTATVNSTYHLQGWVKAEVPADSTAGLITRCSSSGNCGYDLYNAAPGLFTTQSSGGWVKLDIIVTKTQANSEVLSLDCFANQGAKIWCDDLSLTQETSGGTLLRSDRGVVANANGSPLKFQTGPNICTLDHVGVTANAYLLTAVGETANPTPTAEAFPVGSQTPIQNIANVYSWDWSWLSGTSAVATVTMTGAAGDDVSTADATAVSNGRTFAEAKAKVTFNSLNRNDQPERTGRSDISVDICDNPWIFKDDLDGQTCGAGGGQCNVYNFQLFYCQGNNGQSLLPNFSYKVIEGVNAADSTRLKSYFFKVTQPSRDTIGLLIFKNDGLLSPNDWFTQRFPLQTGAASTTINGYPAVKTGTTTYVGVTNHNGNRLEGLMFVLDYNSNNASDATKNIYGQIIDHLLFNRNDDSATQQAIIHDTKRGQDLASIKVALDNYKTVHGAYPKLDSGSYLPGFSTSTWPSWQATLGSLLNKSLPTDVANTFSPACPAGFDGATCWNEPQHAFQCPANSHIYLYHSDGSTYSLYSHMEYTGSNGLATPGVAGTDPCSGQTGSSCGCFNYTVASP